jgi:hypothetical protein
VTPGTGADVGQDQAVLGAGGGDVEQPPPRGIPRIAPAKRVNARM